MRLLTGGHAIWMGGWSTQVHHARDVIETDPQGQGLHRSADALAVLRREAQPTAEADEMMLPPAYALADSLVHGDHRIMPPDEIDPDYLDRDELPALEAALRALGASAEEIARYAARYADALTPEEFRPPDP